VLTILLPYLSIIAVLLFCSAFFSGSESAMFSLDRYELEKLEAGESRAGRAVQTLLSQPRRLLATILLGNELVNITISAVGLAAVFALEEEYGAEAVPWWLNIVVVTPLLLMFGEIVPKAIAVRAGISWARFVALPLKVFGFVFGPIRLVLQGVANGVLALMRIEADDPLAGALQEAQFKALVKLGEKQGVIAADEAELIHRVFDLNETPVHRIMTPRADLVSVCLTSPMSEILADVAKSQYSRVPVWIDDPDRIVGVLLTKDLLRYRWLGTRTGPKLNELVQPAYFVPPGKPCGDMLQEFQAERGHMAIVLDEHGDIEGLVTLQDILEELFEPYDLEDRPDVPTIEQLSEVAWRVPAKLEVAEWNREMDPEIPLGESYNTVAGYIFERFGRLPRKGEVISDRNWIFKVAGMDGTRMTWIVARRRDPRTLGGTP
jgi:putative hemolysin